jgi:dipeptidyl aminopeptidase/acylaminoacyl peptidase
MFLTQRTPDINSPGYHGVDFVRVGLGGSRKAEIVLHYPSMVHSPVWVGDGAYFVAGVENKSNSSQTVYRAALRSGEWQKYAFGEKSCVSQTGLKRREKSIALVEMEGLVRRVLLNEHTVYEGSHDIRDWDVGFTGEGKGTKAMVVFTKGDGNNPEEVWSFVDGKSVQLSAHGTHIAKIPIAHASPIYATAKDGTALDGVFYRPASTFNDKKPLPTIVWPHGGPYWSISTSFSPATHSLTLLLATAGYAMLLPNYRGGSARGEKFAAAARGGVGTKDYDDVITLLRRGIEEGLIDEKRVIIGGWSQGGYLTYVAVTRPEVFLFRGAIAGAGVVDWDMMSMTSDAAYFEAELAGKAPWESSSTELLGRRGSPIWHMHNVRVKTPMLILHGEDDVRVPWTQANAFHRGCVAGGWEAEFVTYPREGHFLDMARRVRRFCDLHLS